MLVFELNVGVGLSQKRFESLNILHQLVHPYHMFCKVLKNIEELSSTRSTRYKPELMI